MTLKERVFRWLGVGGAAAPTFAEAVEVRRDAADRRVTEGLAGASESIPALGFSGIDPDDGMYRRLSSGESRFRRDLSPIQQDRALQVSWYLLESNALAKRVIELTSDLVVGEGVSCAAKDERIAEVLATIWQRLTKGDAGELFRAEATNGEILMPVVRNPITGVPRFGFIDPMLIHHVEFDPADQRQPIAVVLKRTASDASEGQRFEVIREDEDTGRLVGDCLYHKINSLPNASRGRPDLLTLADVIDLYDQSLYGNAESQRALSSFVWDYEIKGATNQKEIEDKARRLGSPKSGQVFAHNEKESLKAITPNLHAADRGEAQTTLLQHVGGTMGFALSWLGHPDSNRATIEGQNDILFKTPKRRQNTFRAFLSMAVRYGIEGVVETNPAYYRGRDLSFTIDMPEIAAKDIARVGGVLSSVVQALDTAMANETMSRRSAVVLTCALARHLGVEFDIEEIMREVDTEREARTARDDARAADVARLGALRATGGDGGRADGGE